MRRWVFTLLFVLSAASTSFAQAGQTTVETAAGPDAAAAIAELHRSLDGMLRRADQPPPPGLSARMAAQPLRGISMALIHRGRVHWIQAVGEARRGVPITPQTRLQAGSISKPFAALTAMRLAQANGIGFDADLRPQLKAWQPPDDPPGSPARYTLRHLLSHTAGLSQHGFPGYAVGQPLPSLPQILDGLPPASNKPVRPILPAGERWQYSGGGSTVVELWIESVSGEPFAAAVDRQLLQPLSLAHSSYGVPPVDAASGAFAASHQGLAEEPGGWRVYPQQAAAGLWSTPRDIAQVLLAVQRAASGEGSSTQVLSPAIAKAATTVHQAPSSLGFFIDEKPARFGHNGSNQGFESMAFMYRDRGEGVVLMANGQNSWGLFEAIVRTLARIYGWRELAAPQTVRDQRLPRDAARWVGEYALPDRRPLRVRVHGAKLWIDSGPGHWKQLWRDPNGRYATEDGLRDLALSAKGAQTEIDGPVVLRQALQKLPDIYLRGSFNAWQAAQAMQPINKHTWRIDVDLAQGSHELKLGDKDWRTVDLGSGADRSAGLKPSAPEKLSARGRNLVLEVSQAGRYRFELRYADSPAAPALTVKRL